MRILYFVPALDDPVLSRRVRILQLGGAEVDLIGFRRGAQRIESIEGVLPSGDLGQTFHGKLGLRTLAVVSRSLRAWEWKALVKQADVLLARNLEMATIAAAARAWIKNRPLIYEVLDIHNAMTGKRLPSKVLRQWERLILNRSAGLIVSSPAFISQHFGTLGCKLPPVTLIENKRVPLPPDFQFPRLGCEIGPPWKIGWYGFLRCEKSFDLLYELAASYPRQVEIEIRGWLIENIQRLMSSRPPLQNMRYFGTYQQSEVPDIYSKCHFIWTIDYYQQGLNSDWLLPNRLYDGLLFGTPVLARAETEVARWLNARQVGVVFSDPSKELPVLLTQMTAAGYRELRESIAVVPRSDLLHTVDECRSIVQRLALTA